MTARIRRGLRPVPRTLLTICLCGMLLPGRVLAAQELEDHFTRDWYYTEVIVFVRPTVSELTAGERLAQAPAPLARDLRTFRAPPDQRWTDFRLSPFTRAYLSFPYLDVARLDESQLALGDESFDGGTGPAGGVPEDTGPGAARGGVAPPAIAPRLEPDPLLDFLADVADFEASLAADSYRWLGPETFVLTPHADALTRRAGYEVLLHGRWLQPVPPRESPEPLLVQLGPRYGDRFALEGTFTVTLGRYLHFGAHLLYSEPLLGRLPMNRPLPPTQSRSTGAAPAGAAVVKAALSLDDLTPAGFMELNESRRVSDEEVSYFDHPKLGVLVRIQPVMPPPALVAAHEALEAEQGKRATQ